MASEPGDSDSEQAKASREPEQCMPCHGSGEVISNLGGTPKRVTCPWCRGGGVRLSGIDAQANLVEPDPDAGPAPEPPPDAAS